MDVLAAMIFGIIIVKSVEDKGYTSVKSKYKTAKNASIIAGLGLLIVYFGLTYLGATASKLFDLNVGRSELIVDITYRLLGNGGIIVIGVVVTLACLTTAIALITSTADYFHEISNEKLGYKFVATVTAIVSALIAMVGIDQIVAIAAPVLSLLYPGALTLLVLSFLKNKISTIVGPLNVIFLENIIISTIVENDWRYSFRFLKNIISTFVEPRRLFGLLLL